MPNLEYFLVAESVSIDQDSNSTSVFNVLEEVAAGAFPTAIPHAAAIAVWLTGAADEGVDWQATLRVTLPGSDRPHDFATNFTVAPGVLRHRLTQKMIGIPLVAEGNVRFELLLNGAPQAKHITTVRRATEAELARLQTVREAAPRAGGPE